MNREEIETEFLSYYSEFLLFRQIENAFAKYRILEYLNELDDKGIKALNLSPFFWSQVLDALNTDVIVSTSRIYDVDRLLKPRSRINIFKFMSFVKHYFNILFSKESVWERNIIQSERDWKAEAIPPLNIQEIREDLHILEQKKEKILTLLFYRDKSYAHTDRNFVLNKSEIHKNKIIKNREIKSLIELAYDLMKKYRLAFDGTNYTFPAANLNDFPNTLEMLLTNMNRK